MGQYSQYPALKADWDGSGTATVIEFGKQGLLAPFSIDPEFGAVGETVTITRTRFSSTDADYEVTSMGATGTSDVRVAPISSSNANGDSCAQCFSGALTGQDNGEGLGRNFWKIYDRI